GSREADQRAEQRMAKDQQLKGGADEGKTAEAKSGAVVAEEKKTLYDRLGSADGVGRIVEDFVTRLVADPQVNFERKGIKVGGLSLKRNQSVEWQATPANLAAIKKSLAEFIALKSGGPTQYSGPDFKAVAEGKKVTNAEFDAAVGDLKATLDMLKIANQEQKELVALMESTRPQFVEER
ncbi:group 1 truncated hemoglobin, partial [bacterium]